MTVGLLIDLCGWVGMALLLGAYLLVSKHRLDGRSAVYQWMNFVGASLLGVNTLYHGAYPATGLNTFWAIIGLVALIGIWRRRRASSSGQA